MLAVYLSLVLAKKSKVLPSWWWVHSSMAGMHTEIFSKGGGGELGPHKRMTLAIMIIAYIYTSICLLRFALFS